MLGQHVCPWQSRDAPIRPYFYELSTNGLLSGGFQSSRN